MTKKFCDLHTHSVYSDGSYTPTELIREAVSLGLSAIALTDHNTLGGLAEFEAAAEGKDIEAVAGIEISTDYGEVELHILGLWLPRERYSEIDRMMSELRERKEASNRAMAEALITDGYNIDYDAILAKCPGVANRAHIAAELVERGYVRSIEEAFATLLGKSCPYYRPARRLPVLETIGYLRSIGAVPVLAHPFLDLDEASLRVFLPKAKAHGLLAMETLYSGYDEPTRERAKRVARELGLAESGGSDFHGARRVGNFLARGRGDLAVPSEFAEQLRSLRRL